MEDDTALWTERETQIEGFASAASSFMKNEEAFFTQEKNRRQKLNDHRRDCNDSIRKANRDTKFSVQLQCYRTDLTLIRDIVQKQKEYIGKVPGVTEGVRLSALSSADALLSAINTMMQAIEAGVYRAEADLLDAKKNLFGKYRAPYSDALTFLRIDRTHTWTIRLLVLVHSLIENETGESDYQRALSETLACYEDANSAVESILSLKNSEFRVEFRQAQSDLKSCSELLHETAKVNTNIEQ